MEYPCGMNYCGCNMTKISNCEDCYYRSTHRDMGASWDVCTLHKDLSSATIACENSDNCKSKITYKEVNQAIEKQIPKKIVVNKYIYTKCDCGYEFSKHYGDGYYDVPYENRTKYCKNCGQRLDWSEEE